MTLYRLQVRMVCFATGLSILVTGCGPQLLREDEVSRTYSLTNSKYAGKKSYFGWGAASSGDPSNMHNEVKYDVLHTHDIFTSGAGGNYLSNKLVGGTVSRDQISSQWSALKKGEVRNDMYVQYSSGHGFPGGLAVGVSYADMASQAIGLGAKETIVFTMACYSGGFVNAVERRKSEWQNFDASGRTLFVMASSTVDQTSSTGPGTDSAQAGGPSGSAGSAYGHSLWKALSGAADGYLDGVKDGFISLGEIVTFSTDLTIRIGRHTPVFTGSFDPLLIMNRVPSSNYLAAVSNPSDDASMYDIQESTELMDRQIAAETASLLKKNPILKSYSYAGQLYVSVAAAADTSALLVSAPKTAASVVLCEGESDTSCTTSSGKSLTLNQPLVNVSIFNSAAVSLQVGKKFGFVAFDATGQILARRTVVVVAQTAQNPAVIAPVVTPEVAGTVAIQEMHLTVPSGWSIKQDAADEQKLVVVLRNKTKALSIYVAKQTVDMKSMFAASGSQITRAERQENIGGRTWLRQDSAKTLKTGARGFSGTKNVAAFKLELNGNTYFGYGTGDSSLEAEAAVSEILGALR